MSIKNFGGTGKVHVDLHPENLLFKDKWFPINRLMDIPAQLMVIVDTEEEFDWNAPFDRLNVNVDSVAAQLGIHEIFSRYGIRPTYVMDYAVASQPAGYGPLRKLLDRDQCLIGAHLHPWVNQPHEEAVNDFNSYPGNLPPDLERRKLEVLTGKITENFGQRPVIYKAGRYGLGPETFNTLSNMKYQVDLSPGPYHDLREKHGPDFSRVRPHPYWIGGPGDLLTIPLTRGFYGPLGDYGPRIDSLLEKPISRTLMLRDLLSRAGLLERCTLTPEGVPVEEYTRLVEHMIAQGHRIFCMTYHSPSLAPGNTPYVRSQADLALFISSIARFLETFFNRLGGQPTDPLSLRRLLLERASNAGQVKPA